MLLFTIIAMFLGYGAWAYWRFHRAPDDVYRIIFAVIVFGCSGVLVSAGIGYGILFVVGETIEHFTP